MVISIGVLSGVEPAASKFLKFCLNFFNCVWLNQGEMLWEFYVKQECELIKLQTKLKLTEGRVNNLYPILVNRNVKFGFSACARNTSDSSVNYGCTNRPKHHHLQRRKEMLVRPRQKYLTAIKIARWTENSCPENSIILSQHRRDEV